MKKINKTLSILITISMLSLIIPQNVKANQPSNNNGFWQNTIDFIKSICEVGTIMRVPDYSKLNEWEQSWKSQNNVINAPSNPSENELMTYLNQGVIVNGDLVTYSGDTWDFMKYVMNQVRTEYGYEIAYPYNIASYVNNSYEGQSGARNFPLFQAEYQPFVFYQGKTGGLDSYSIDLIKPKNTFYGIKVSSGHCNLKTFAGSSSFSVKRSPYYNRQVSDQTGITFSNILYSSVSGNTLKPSSDGYTYSCYGACGNSFYVYYSTSAVQTSPAQPYYYTKDSYNENITKDSYNTTTTSIDGSLSYGDITNYINIYKENNDGNDPSPIDVNIYIETYIPPTPEPTPTPTPSTGTTISSNGVNVYINNNPTASNTNNNSYTDNSTNNYTTNNNFDFSSLGLSGNTVSGNGSGGSGGIFDWLGSVGKTLGNLIKGLGELISNLLEGIVETVTTVLSSLPNILTPLIEFVFGGLPEELQAMITLGITCVIMVAVIKAIKG